MAAVINVNETIDRHPVSAYQIGVLVLCMLVAALDGFDTQAIGYVAPAIIGDWKIAPAALTGVFSAGTFGILIGCLFVAPLADRFGRRPLILLCLVEFGVGTLATSEVQSLQMLIALRFLTGIGLGACMSNAIALTSEYIPSRSRATITTWTFCGYALGAFLAGIVVANLNAHYGWRSTFVVGGTLPLLLALFAFVYLPESLYRLAAKPGAGPKIAAILRRFDCGSADPDKVKLIYTEPGMVLPVGQLFREGRAGGTVLLWAMFFFMLVEVFLLTSWTPTLLHQTGMSISDSVMTMAIIQGGGVIALLMLGPIFDRVGFLVTLVPLLLAASLAIAALGNVGAHIGMIKGFAFVAGAGVMGGQSSLIVLAAIFYPSSIRSTGVGWALGLGRLGAVVGPLLGGLMVSLKWDLAAIFAVAACIPVLIAALLFAMDRFTPLRLPGRKPKAVSHCL
jgi:MFS transporter, AAHS family, 4-hydroxybenzoate transporter